MFLLILGCIGLWGFEKYMDSASLLHQLDLKVNTPNTNIPTSVLTPSEVTKQIAELRATLDKTQHFVTRSTDARGRRMLDAQDVGYLAASSAATELPKDWNAGPFGHNTSTQIETSDYRLQIPFNEAWGNAAYTVSPYERNQQEQILFGPITYMEMTGA